MKYMLLRTLSVIAFLGVIGAVPGFSQSFTRALPAPADGRIAPEDGGVSSPLGFNAVQVDTSLSYYSFDGLPFRIPLGQYPPGGADSKAVGLFFDAPFSGTVDEVHFALYGTAGDPGVEGSGTLRLKMTEVPETMALDSLDLDFSELETGGFPQAGNLSNQVDLTTRNFEIIEGRQYFFEFELVDETSNASLDFLFDAGSDDMDDTDHYPARSFVFVIDGEGGQYVRLVDPDNPDFQNLNLFMELKLSRAPTAQVQVLHNTASVSLIDVYIGDTRVANNLTFQEATAFVEAPVGENTLTIVNGTSATNTNPLFSTTVDLEEDLPYLAMIYGAGSELGMAVEDLSGDSSREQGRIFVANGGLESGPVDVNLLGDTGAIAQVLADDLALGEVSSSAVTQPPPYKVEVALADGTQVDVFLVTVVSSGEGDSFSKSRTVLAVSGRGNATSPLSVVQVQPDGSVIEPAVVTDIEEAGGVPARFALHNNYPNPFNPTTTIAFDLATSGFTTLRVYNLLGQEVATLVEGTLPASTYQVAFDAGTLPSGAYVYRLESSDYTQQKMLMLVK